MVWATDEESYGDQPDRAMATRIHLLWLTCQCLPSMRLEHIDPTEANPHGLVINIDHNLPVARVMSHEGGHP